MNHFLKREWQRREAVPPLARKVYSRGRALPSRLIALKKQRLLPNHIWEALKDNTPEWPPRIAPEIPSGSPNFV